MQLAFDAADRLVELLELERGPVAAEDAARRLFALRHVPAGLARDLLDDVVGGDARLAWRGGRVALATPPGAGLRLEQARYVVFDLETTGLRPGQARICEIGAVAVGELELRDEFATLVDPGVPLPAAITALTGIQPPSLRGAPRAELAVRRFLAFAGDAVLVAHNARFDMAFLDREVERLTGRRVAAPVVDTVRLARRLVGGRCSLAALAFRFGCSTEPCHRALPDARATAEVLVRLLGLAQERGAETVADVVELSAPRARRLASKRSLAAGAPQRPGVYLFRDRVDNVLYVGRARDLRARLRSYFASERQRPAVEAALGALDRIEWRVLGSELEAALEELRLIRQLRPPANAQGKRNGVYLRRRGDDWVCSEKPGPFGPIRSRRLAREAARALSGLGVDDPADGVPLVRARLARLAAQLRFEDAARRRDRLAALEKCVAAIAVQRRLRALETCVLAPAAQEGLVRAFFVRGGRVAATRTWLEGPAAAVEVDAGLADAFRAAPSDAPDDAAELAVLAQFLRRPPPELRVVPLRREAILRAGRPERAVA